MATPMRTNGRPNKGKRSLPSLKSGTWNPEAPATQNRAKAVQGMAKRKALVEAGVKNFGTGISIQVILSPGSSSRATAS